MAHDKTKVALVYGGRSAEHEVSLRSAYSIFQTMDPNQYDVLPILITKDGAWYRLPAAAESFEPEQQLDESHRLLMSPDPQHNGLLKMSQGGRIEPLPVDVVFPVIHGTFGEDGTLQGLFDLAGVPYVGCGVLASSLGMDKVVVKSAFQRAGLHVAPYFWFLRSAWNDNRPEIMDQLEGRDFPLFVKPANLGSSVGVSKVDHASEFEEAVDIAAQFDRKVLVEEAVHGRELEVSVLGYDTIEASIAGEVISHSGFYDYEEKYINDTAELIIPAELSTELHEQAGECAIKAFKAIDGSGLARVDMFLTPEQRFVINEVNTLPGFTSISMYPKLWEESGLSYSDLVVRLIELAMERHTDRSNIRTLKDLS